MNIPPISADFDFPDLFNVHQEEEGSFCNRITNWAASFFATPTQSDLNHELDNNIEQVEILLAQEEDRVELGTFSEALKRDDFAPVEILLDDEAIHTTEELREAIYRETPTKLFRRLVQKAKDVNEKDKRGRSLLWNALHCSDFKAAHILLDQGAIPFTEDISRSIDTQPTELFLRLVQRLEDMNEKDEFGRSPLCRALYYENIEAANILLDHGAIPTTEDLLKAIRWLMPIKLVQRLVKKVEDVNEKDGINERPLDTALKYNKSEVINVLFENGADLTLVDPSIRLSPKIASIVEFYRTSQECVRNLNGVLRRFIFEDPE